MQNTLCRHYVGIRRYSLLQLDHMRSLLYGLLSTIVDTFSLQMTILNNTYYTIIFNRNHDTLNLSSMNLKDILQIFGGT